VIQHSRLQPRHAHPGIYLAGSLPTPGLIARLDFKLWRCDWLDIDSGAHLGGALEMDTF
jgi:hypothetical protein